MPISLCFLQPIPFLLCSTLPFLSFPPTPSPTYSIISLDDDFRRLRVSHFLGLSHRPKVGLFISTSMKSVSCCTGFGTDIPSPPPSAATHLYSYLFLLLLRSFISVACILHTYSPIFALCGSHPWFRFPAHYRLPPQTSQQSNHWQFHTSLSEKDFAIGRIR